MSRVGLSLRGSLRQSATSSKTVAPRRIISLPGTSQRRYNSTGSDPSQRPGSSSRARSLAVPAAVGFGIGLATVVFGRGVSADDGKLRCDGAPAIEFVDTHGYPWKPVDAYEHDDPRNPMRIRMATWVKELQDHIVTTLEAIEASHPPHPSDPSPSSTPPPKFLRDAWIRPEGGEGSSCVLANGRVFEKAGVNVSIVHGQLPPAAQRQMRADHSSLPISTESMPFFATGLSIVIHPRNPHVPTVHLNYRYFEVEDPKNPNGDPVAWWFGGGSDLTPSYTDEGDIRHFHSTLKDACDKHDKRYWNVFKPWCDKYFYITHRNESRGVGGIFFDDLTTSSPIHSDRNLDQNEIFSFVKDVSSSFLPSYVPIVWKNKDMGWTEEERRWQLLRRGRYVEFNLVHDRGTKFGLMTPGARIESILMSLPETARWEYMSEMGKPGTKEGDLIELLKNPKEWA